MKTKRMKEGYDSRFNDSTSEERGSILNIIVLLWKLGGESDTFGAITKMAV